MNKLCDGADWFRPEIDRIIRNEFRDVPRFHRKQWEFAVIFRALEQNGFLNPGSCGISFGSGTEHMLYSVAHRVKHIWATDLYEPSSTWDIARTDNPIELIRSRAPFPYPDGSISARNMDMRNIEFPDESFDFAYSSCAIEHIGKREDFVRHLAEVKRVLKPGGLYAFTTELTYADRTVELVGNYYFSRALLEDIVRASGMESDAEFDASLAFHRINMPIPVEFSYEFDDGEGRFNEKFLGTLCHVQLSTANLAFTSCLVVLRKSGRAFNGWSFTNWAETAKFIDEGIGTMRAIVEHSDLKLHPFSWMPERKSHYFTGHAHYFQGDAARPGGRTLFHTAYVWLGSQPRVAHVSMSLESREKCVVALKIYRRQAITPWVIEVESRLAISSVGGWIRRNIEIKPRDDCTYAVLAELEQGEGLLSCVAVDWAAVGDRPNDQAVPDCTITDHKPARGGALAWIRGFVGQR